MKRFLLLPFFTTLLVAADGQTSRYLGSVELFDEVALEYGGPYHLDDTTVVYRDVNVARVLTHPEADSARAVRLTSTTPYEGPVSGLTRGADGTVYLLTGGGNCDVIGSEWALHALQQDSQGAWVANRIGEPFTFERTDPQLPLHFDVAADTTLWLVTGQDVLRWWPGANAEAGFAGTDVLSDTRGRVIAVDRDTAFSTSGYDGYHLVRSGDGTRKEALPEDGSGPTSLGRRGSDVVWLTGEQMHVYPFGSGEANLTVMPPAVVDAPVTFVNDALALAVRRDTLVRWDLRTGETAASLYYPDVFGWGLRTASVNAAGDLALLGETQQGTVAIPEAVPANHLFLQYVPVGADPYMPAPEVSIVVVFDQTRDERSGVDVATYEVTVTNESDVVLTSARVVNNHRFGLICPEFWNGATFEDLAAGQSATRGGDEDELYRTFSAETVPEGRQVEDYFTVAHVNGRPTDVGQRVDYDVTSLAEVIEDPSLMLSPNPVTTALHLRWEGQPASVVIINALGQVAFRQNLRRDAQEAGLDVQVLPEGHYYLAVTGAEGTAVRAFQVVD